MNVTINANITVGPALGEVMTILSDIQNRVQQLSQKETQMDAVLQQKIDDLVTRVTTLATIEQSTETLLTGLSSMIADLKTDTTDPAQLKAIDDVLLAVSDITSKASAALVANTPVAV